MSNLVSTDKKIDIVLYSVKEAAEVLEISSRTVMTYIYSGKLKAAKIGGKWKITKSNIERFMRGEPQE